MNWRVLNLRIWRFGGNGDLYLGERSDNGEQVVDKYLREYANPQARRAFEREISVLSRGCPGMVSLLFSDTSAERPHYVTPYLPGGSLTKYAGRLTENQLHNVATDLARTLANLGCAHGDVKPDNTLVTQDGHLKIADPLGPGAVFTMLFSNNCGGTPGYLAPEVGAGGSISCAGDVYSYGVTLFHLRAGRMPQDGELIDGHSGRHTHASKIGQIIAACCQVGPAARPTMQEVLRMLGGEQWANIQSERKQREELMATVFLSGLAILLAFALKSSRVGR